MPGAVTFRVRAATPDDAPMLARHRVEMFREMGRVGSGSLGTELRDAAERQLGEWLAAGHYVGWLAEPASRPGLAVGGAGIHLRPMLPRPGRDGQALETGPEAYVANVYVERAWRRRGVASLLMEYVVGYARERRLRVVTLHATPEGRPLYERIGFRPTNEMKLQE
jgi:GNAT superfamily N-acetyltransferase